MNKIFILALLAVSTVAFKAEAGPVRQDTTSSSDDARGEGQNSMTNPNGSDSAED